MLKYNIYCLITAKPFEVDIIIISSLPLRKLQEEEMVSLLRSKIGTWEVRYLCSLRAVAKALRSCPGLCMTPWTADTQVPPSMGYSRQEYWSGLP